MAAAVVHVCGNSAIEIVRKVCNPAANEVIVEPGKKGQEPWVTLSNGVNVTGVLTAIKAIARPCSGSSLLGHGPLQQAEVEQWLEYCFTQVMPCLNEATEVKEKLCALNTLMVDRVYMVGNCLTVCDLLLFSVLHDVYHKMTFEEKEKYINVSRWFRQVQSHPSISDPEKDVRFLRNLLYH